MKGYKIFMLAALLTTTSGLYAQSNYSLSGYTLTIDGTSNLHKWNETVQKVKGKGDVKRNGEKSFTLESFNIVAEVSSIKSSEGHVMDNKTYDALKADKFPDIIFSLTEPVISVPSAANAYTVSAKGRLSIAGVTRPVIMHIKISDDGNNSITVEGAQEVKMTDYNIKPPTALFGMLKVGDAITINFKATFQLFNQSTN